MRLVERWNVDSAAAPQDEMPQAAIQAVLHHAVDGVLQARDREFGSSLSFRGPPPACPVVRALSREPERPQQNKPIPSTGKPLGQQKLERYLDRLSA